MDFLVKNALENMPDPESNMGHLDVREARMCVVGCGGAGQNAIHWLYNKGIKGAKIIAVNTDIQDLKYKGADQKILIGKECARGLGAGGDHTRGAAAANENITEIKEAIKDYDMVFICAGMGGGTGTGSAPVVAKAARDMGAIVIGVVTMPFKTEGARIDKAEYGLRSLRKNADTCVVIDNNRLVNIAGNLPIKQAFAVGNEIISTMIKGIVEIISVNSLINLDFADIKNIMKSGGVSTVGIGTSDSSNRVQESVDQAMSNPLLEVSYEGATGCLIHVTGGEDMKLDEVDQIGKIITEKLDNPEANVIWGARVDDNHSKRITVMTIITGVKSPYILGPESKGHKIEAGRESSNDLGVDFVY